MQIEHVSCSLDPRQKVSLKPSRVTNGEKCDPYCLKLRDDVGAERDTAAHIAEGYAVLRCHRLHFLVVGKWDWPRSTVRIPFSVQETQEDRNVRQPQTRRSLKRIALLGG